VIQENDLELSAKIEDVLVQRNVRGMRYVQAALAPGYCLRAAALLYSNHERVLIGTGFPVAGTFETDGPVGAIALYNALESLGGTPVMACGSPLYDVLQLNHRTQELSLELDDNSPLGRAKEATRILELQRPTALLSIERPGPSASGQYFNMRREDISDKCAWFDECMRLAECPTIGIGDGGNEIGMGNVIDTIAKLDIEASVSYCDELLVADVSNWAAYGIIAFLGRWSGKDLLANCDPEKTLRFLSEHGSVDGVTCKNTISEDGLDVAEGLLLIEQLQRLAA